MKSLILIVISLCLCSARNLDDTDLGRIKPQHNDFISVLLERISAQLEREDDDVEEDEDYLPDELRNLMEKNAEQNPATDDEYSRIFGGSVAPEHAYPYLAGLSIRSGSRSSWCGGSIISDQYVVTAAHCVRSATSIILSFGAHRRTGSDEPGRQTQTVTSGNIIVHPQWGTSRLVNDIALIRLNVKLTFTNQIQSIALPPSVDETFEGQIAVVAGWGHYNSNKKLSSKIRHTQAPVMKNSDCKRYFEKYLQDTNVCLDGKQGKGTCNGDSGGPMAVNSPAGKPILIGLTSFGSGKGCGKGTPTVFTRLSMYLPWIEEVTGAKPE